MDPKEFQAHVVARFDRLDAKMDVVSGRSVAHEQQIQHLQGFAKYVIVLLIAVSGFFATAFFKK
jgi:hypothetical protein